MAVLDLTYNSKILGMPAELEVLLPEFKGLKKRGDTYPVVWMLHGANNDCSEWLYTSSVARYAERYGFAVVLPSIYNGFGVNMTSGENYADFLAEELPGAVRRLFPCLSTKREENFVAGASMGGYAAFRWAMNRPDLFCAAGSFAGSLLMDDIFRKFLEGTQPGGDDFYTAFGTLDRMVETENDIFYMARKNQKEGKPLPRMFMVCGTEDFGYRQNVAARDRLIAQGCDVTWHTSPGIHSMDCWDPFIPTFFDWLNGKKEGAM